ncbi:hypothetical protein E2C01_037938 [Portunus trituberculatus]|uniref:Uncharacterized protein n=1 Tax=Portunus trituberculatus TaxID=210409 RepID=A0A5B7FGA3_PORTR|nr:hypothetical protein [Portunus trituberculatus]
MRRKHGSQKMWPQGFVTKGLYNMSRHTGHNKLSGTFLSFSSELEPSFQECVLEEERVIHRHTGSLTQS